MLTIRLLFDFYVHYVELPHVQRIWWTYFDRFILRTDHL